MKVELKVIGGARTGQTIPIATRQFMIGRADDCHLKPRSELISRYHCAVLSEDGYIAVRDLGSKNGVYVNGRRVSIEEELKNGDRLAIGPLEFEVVLSVGLQGETKPKISSISDVVSRTVAQNASGSVKVAPAPIPTAAPAPAPTPAAVPTPTVAAPAPAPAPIAPSPVVAQKDSENDGDVADWLLGDDDVPEETQTLQMAVDMLDLPYSPQEPEKKPEPAPEKKSSGPNSSDAAANLLKNFFKGGR